MEINNDLHKIFCKWNSGFKELAEYFHDKYNFDIDDEDIAATKELFMEMANDVPKIANIALHGHNSKIEEVKAKGKTKTTEQISIVLNDKEAAEKILHELLVFVERYGGLDICDIERIVSYITGNYDFGIDADYVLFTREEARRIYLTNRDGKYEIIFPYQEKAITLGCGKED